MNELNKESDKATGVNNESSTLDNKGTEERIKEMVEKIKEQEKVIQSINNDKDNLSKKLDLLLDTLKLNAVKSVDIEDKQDSNLANMEPKDYVNHVYDTVVDRVNKYRDPGELKDYEAGIYILKQHGIPEDKIANFIFGGKI